MKDFFVQTASFSRELREDFTGCMEKIAAAGYAGVELFDAIHGGMSPSELKSCLAGLGMRIIGSHVNVENTDAQLAYLPETGCRYVVCPGIRVASRDEAYRAAETLNECGKKTAAAGMRYGYHNHNSDFDRYGDETVIDILLANTDPALVTFELDAAWAWRAGYDAAEFVRKHAGRIGLIHVKETSRVLGPEDDLSKLFANAKRGPDGRPIFDEEARARFEEHRKINCKLGDGLINMPALMAAADIHGTEAYIVEREYGYTGDIFTSLAEDAEYMRAL